MTWLIVILSLGIVPIGIAYCINTLFGLNIPYSFETWYCFFFLGLVFRFLITPVVIQNQNQIVFPPSEKDELPPPKT